VLELLFLGKTEGKRFVVLGDGRTLYVPLGRRGPVYLVPDEETRQRLEWRFKVADRIAAVALGGGTLLAMLARAWLLVPVLIALGALLPRWMDRVVAESLPEAHDPDARLAAERHQPGATSLVQRLVGLGGAAALMGYGLYRWTNYGGLSDFRALGALFLGVVVLLTSLSDWGDERADEYLACADVPPDSTPIEPKYF
jgi:hypothetical protein